MKIYRQMRSLRISQVKIHPQERRRESSQVEIHPQERRRETSQVEMYPLKKQLEISQRAILHPGEIRPIVLTFLYGVVSPGYLPMYSRLPVTGNMKVSSMFMTVTLWGQLQVLQNFSRIER